MGRREKGGEGREKGREKIYFRCLGNRESIVAKSRATKRWNLFRVLFFSLPSSSLPPRVIRETTVLITVLHFPSSWWHVFFNMFVTNARFRMERRRWIATLEAILRESERDVRFMIRGCLQGFFEKFFFVWEGEGGEVNIQIVEDFRNRNHYHFMLMKFRGKVFGIDPRVRISSEGRKEGRKEREIYFCPFNWTYRQAPMQISPKLDEKVMKSQIICGTTWKFG